MRFAIPLLLLALCACEARRGGRLDGHWKGVRAEGVAREAAVAANTFAAHVELDVRGSSIRIATPEKTRTAEFTVTKDDEHEIVIVTSVDGPSDPQSFTILGDKMIAWTALPGKTIVFAKQ